MNSRVETTTLARCRKYGKKEAFLLTTFVAFIVTPVELAVLKSGPSAEPTLRLVSIVHRHGDRAPEEIEAYPSFPYKGEKYWPNGVGALVERGKRTMYELGRFFRQRYDGIISPTYSPAEVRSESSDTERCITSAQLVVAGLYPPVENQTWNPDLPWDPVPIHALTPSCDDKIKVSKPCALLLKEKKEWKRVSFEKLAENQKFLAYISENMGQKIENTLQVYHIHDYFSVVQEHGYLLPQWVRNVTDQLYTLIWGSFMRVKGFKQTTSMIKLQSGVLINEILSNMERKANFMESFERRLNLYSGHDLNLLFLWEAMNFSREMPWRPKYGAALIIELHEIESKYRVKILYKWGSSPTNLTVLKTRGCNSSPASEQDEMCDLATFSSTLQSAVITNFDEACKVPPQ